MLRLRVLGSSGIHPIADNPATGFLVETEETCLWLDAGTGTFAAFQQVEDLARVSAVVITHGHGDHCLDIIPLHYAMRFHPQGPFKVPLIAPDDVWRRLSAFLLGAEGETENPTAGAVASPRTASDDGGNEAGKLGRTFDFRPAEDGDTAEIGDLRLSFRRTEHQVPTLAVRIEHGDRVLVYTADTGPAADLAPFAQGAHLLLAEATYAGERVGPPVHLSAAQAGALACRAEARQLVLTHLAPGVDPSQAKEEARGEAGEIGVSLARPGRVIQLT
jgi:ribonuclease BN (tRNA processing enzyme)